MSGRECAVSYTHLDVYKRQGQDNWLITEILGEFDMKTHGHENYDGMNINWEREILNKYRLSFEVSTGVVQK